MKLIDNVSALYLYMNLDICCVKIFFMFYVHYMISIMESGLERVIYRFSLAYLFYAVNKSFNIVLLPPANILFCNILHNSHSIVRKAETEYNRL